MREAHRGLGVRNRDFNALVEDLVRSLNKFNVGSREQRELLGLLGPMRRDVVQRKVLIGARAHEAAATAAETPRFGV